ncbi:MAG: hypothetical protein EAZ14_07385 [Runella slithyformis]|nr:MAG: hypothetical protein EAZ14_07385 [Runella slithyformis]
MLNRLEEIKDSLYKYIETELQLFKIELQGGFESFIIKLIYLFVLLILLFAVGIFLLVLLAVFLNHFWKSDYAGFVAVGALMAATTLFWALASRTAQEWIKKTLHQFFRNQ